MRADVRVARARCRARRLALTSTLDARASRATIEVRREAWSRRAALTRAVAVAALTRAALAPMRWRARAAWVVSALVSALAVRARGRARVVARVAMDGDVGTRCARGTFVPREDARGFEAVEMLSATDAWYAIVCARRGGRARVDVLDGVRCSGEMARVVIATARRCFDDDG